MFCRQHASFSRSTPQLIPVVGFAEIHGRDFVSFLAEPKHPGSLTRQGFLLQVPATPTFLDRVVIQLRSLPPFAFEPRNFCGYQ